MTMFRRMDAHNSTADNGSGCWRANRYTASLRLHG
jgi:hypothetical protein